MRCAAVRCDAMRCAALRSDVTAAPWLQTWAMLEIQEGDVIAARGLLEQGHAADPGYVAVGPHCAVRLHAADTRTGRHSRAVT